jgi:hypothetical protein
MTLPTFMIIGAHKGGTSALWRYLISHPDIAAGSKKEIRFFDQHWDRGIVWYETHFRNIEAAKHVCEATPSMHVPEVPERIAAVFTNIKLIASLRNPGDRAHSHYWSQVTRGKRSDNFDRVVAQEIDEGRGKILEPGFYHAHLLRFEEHLPNAPLHVTFLEDLAADPIAIFAALCEFLAVDPTVCPSVVGERVNAYQAYRSVRVRNAVKGLPKPLRNVVGRFNRIPDIYPPMRASTRARLAAFYRPHNEALTRWLGRPLPSSWDG